MASILAFVQVKNDFDDAVTNLLDETFAAACQLCGGIERIDQFQELIARRIIEAARRGERDPIRLREIGLATFPAYRLTRQSTLRPLGEHPMRSLTASLPSKA